MVWHLCIDGLYAQRLKTEQIIHKICDFGQSRKFFKPVRVIHSEVHDTVLQILDLREYCANVDNWAWGCIAMELFLKTAIFKMEYLDGECALLNKMVSVLGSPSNEWSEFQSLELCTKSVKCKNGKVIKGLYEKRLVMLELM